MTTRTATHYRTCNLCEAMCGLVIEYDGNKVLSIKGDPEDPFSKGYICPKPVALQDVYSDPDRLKLPVKKVGEDWKTISWEEAFALVEKGIKQVQDKHGRDSVAVYLGNPNIHNIGSLLFGSGFYRTLGTKNRYSATSADQLPHHFAAQMMFGHSLLLPVPDIDRTLCFVVIGANPMVSNGSIMTASGMPDRIKTLKARGGKMIVIDPRKTETARKADKHLFIRPGTDVYLLAAILKNILVKTETARLPRWVKGVEVFGALLDTLSIDHVARATGVPVEEIENLTREFLSSESTVLYGRTGVSTQEYGTLCQWLINAINIVSGNFDRPGGAMFPKPAIDILARNKKGTRHRYNRWQSRVRKLPEFGGELPVAVLAEECLTKGRGQVKALICVAGNPVLSTPNGRQLEKALGQMDFVVGIDIYINETNRFADVILPPATGLETSHYALAFHGLAVRNTVKYSKPLFAKEDGMLYDWQIFKALAKRFRKKRAIIHNLISAWLTPERMINIGLRLGPYRLSLSKLRRHPHGIDLGPMKPQLPGRLFTGDKKVDLAPDLFIDALKSAIESMEVPGRDGLLLIGRRHLRSNNSWMHNSIRLVKGPDRCIMLMHPSDAMKHQVTDGDMVRVRALQTGEEVVVRCRTTGDIMPGVVSIPHGWGHHRKGTRWKTAEAHPGVSVNDLTDDRLTDALSGNAVFNGVPVEIVGSK